MPATLRGLFVASIPIRLTAVLLGAFAGSGAGAGSAEAPAILAWEPAVVRVADETKRHASSIRIASPLWDFELALVDNDRLPRRLDSDARDLLRAQDARVVAGHVVGVDGSWARLARIDGQWAGAIFDGHTLWLLDPVERVAGWLAQTPGSRVRSVLYRAVDARLPGAIDPPFGRHSGAMPRAVSVPAKGGPPDRELDLAVYADAQYGALHGANGMAFALARINVVDGIFSAQVGVRIAMSRFTQLDAGDLPSHNFADVLLFRFGELMNGPPGRPKGDLTHLLTARDVCIWDGMGSCVPGSQGVAGIVTEIGRLCHPTDAYGLSEAYANSQVLVLITAHELGHQFGAPHDGEAGSACEFQPAGDWLMKPQIDNNDGTLSPCSLNQIGDDVAAASCLRMLELPLYADGFEG